MNNEMLKNIKQSALMMKARYVYEKDDKDILVNIVNAILEMTPNINEEDIDKIIGVDGTYSVILLNGYEYGFEAIQDDNVFSVINNYLEDNIIGLHQYIEEVPVYILNCLKPECKKGKITETQRKVIKYDKEHLTEYNRDVYENEDCPICLEKEEEDNKFKFLLCGHSFCNNCIDKTFKINFKCAKYECSLCKEFAGTNVKTIYSEYTEEDIQHYIDNDKSVKLIEIIDIDALANELYENYLLWQILGYTGEYDFDGNYRLLYRC